MEKRLINKTTYTKGFYISLTLYKVKHSYLAYAGGFSIVVTLTQGIGLVKDNPVIGWWTLFAGCILMPLIVYIVPFIINMNNYKKTVKENGGKDIDVSMELTDNKIICKNNMGQIQHCKYSDIRDITEKSNLFIVNWKNNGTPMYLSTDPEAFIGCTKEEMYERLERMSGVKIFK